MKRLLVSLAATSILVGIVAGVPWLLLRWGRSPILSPTPWEQWLRPDDGTLTTTLLTLVGWAAWAVFAWSTLAETARQLSRGRVRLRLPGTSWLSPLVSLLVAAALAPLATAHATVPESRPSTAVVVPVTEPTTPAEPTADVEDPATSHRWRRYTVVPGDELWDIAARELGGGQRWREIVAANPGVDPESELTPHTVLLLPATVTVARGDTLWDLAEEHLGDPTDWPLLHEANRDLVTDPDEIDVGWTLTLPGSGTPAPPEGTGPREESPQPPATEPEPGPPAVTTPHSGSETPSEAEPRHADVSPVPTATAPALKVLGPVGALLGAGLMVALASRRRLSLAQREVGQRIPTAPVELSRHWSALGLLAAAEPEPPTEELTPTSVLLGWGTDQEELWCDLEAEPLWLEGGGEEIQSMSAALLTSLLCAEWSHDVDVVTVGADESWAVAVDDPRLTDLPETPSGLERMEQLVADRLNALGDEVITSVRRDPDRAPGFAPTVFLFCTALTAAECATITALLARGRTGVGVVAARTGEGWDGVDPGRLVELFSGTRASATPGGDFTPQLLQAPARRALVGLFEMTGDPGTRSAPWWSPDTPTPLPCSPISEELRMPPKPSSPTLLLLGEAQLVACDGEPPSRSVGRCLEACAWLLAHPGCTPTQMREGLMIAEGTRRSVVSRLRGWLGGSPGAEHLPDAYSGRIELATTVSSDWERFQSLLAGGVKQASEASLTEALALVRGAPLTGYEFQWGWAESLRCDMVSMIVDAAVVLAERCLARSDLESAEWALLQGALAGPNSEALAARRILLRAAQGDRAAVDQEVLQLTRTARSEGRDLSETTVRIIQKALSQCLTTTT